MNTHNPETTIRQLESRLTRALEQLDTVKQIGLALESTMSFDEVLTMAVERTTAVMGAERTTLFLTDDTGMLISRVIEGSDVREIRLHPGQGLAGWTARHGMPLRITDAYEDERFDKSWDKISGFQTRGVMCHPIVGRHGTIIGVTEVLNKIAGQFEEEDLALLGIVCSQIAMTIENSRMMIDLVQKNKTILESKQNLEKRNRELQVLLDLESIVARAEDLDSLGPRVFARFLDILNADLGCLYLADSEGAQSRIVSADGKINSTLRVEAGSGFTGWSATKGKELCIPDPAGDPRIEESIQKRIGIGLRNLSVIPLPFPEDTKTRGALLVANKNKKEGFDVQDMMLLRLVASQLALAIEHLTDRDARERERRLATVGRLLAGVLHDLKSPITVISGYAELLCSQPPGKDCDDYLDHINTALGRITNMASEIIAFSKGEKQLLIHSCPLTDFIDDFVSEVKTLLKSNNVELVVRKRTSGVIRIDEEKMLRAFHNIVINATEAMSNKGQIIFEVDRIGKDIIFSFTDSGSGIPEEIQGTLFQSFVTLGKEHGTGLGLAVVREIVEGHGGRVNFTTSRGGGTTFMIAIPA